MKTEKSGHVTTTGAGEGDTQQRCVLCGASTELTTEMAAYLDSLTITSDNIGDIRHSCFVPWQSRWNGIVRDETAKRELSPATVAEGEAQYESQLLSLRLAQIEERFTQATHHDEIVALVWACRALIDADTEAAPFFTPEAADKEMVYTAALRLYFEHANRVLGRGPSPSEVDEVETGFCNPRLESLKTERFERGKRLLESLAAPAPVQPPVAPCVNCNHANPHDGPAGTINDACTHPCCSCGYYVPSTPTTGAGAAEQDDDDLPVCLLCRHFQGCDCEHECSYTALPIDRETLLDNWPLSDVLNQLATWTAHLGDHHNCDCHGWEAQSFLIPAARIYATLPPTEATQVAVEAAAKEIAEELINPILTSKQRPLRDFEIKEIAGVICKHCTADAGEVERLRRQNHELRTIIDVGTDDDPGTALSKLHKIQYVAHVSAVNQCVSILDERVKCYDEAIFKPPTQQETQRVHEQWPGLVDRISAAMGRMTIWTLIKDLESLTKKEGDDGPQV